LCATITALSDFFSSAILALMRSEYWKSVII
jgi:hypothetical protein